jgi:GTP-binding protein LepA
MVFAGFYPTEGEDYALLREALERLQLNDAALFFEPETSDALNFGFRCGFLGLFHMEIVQERLEREYDLDLVATAPSVRYEIVMAHTDEVRIIDSPALLPDPGEIEAVREPWMHVQIFMPDEYYGVVMELVMKKRGNWWGRNTRPPAGWFSSLTCPWPRLWSISTTNLRAPPEVMPRWITNLPATGSPIW